jgi:hypothetical protein
MYLPHVEYLLHQLQWFAVVQNNKYFLTVLVFELRAIHLLGRLSTIWAMPPALFTLVIFEIGSSLFA